MVRMRSGPSSSIEEEPGGESLTGAEPSPVAIRPVGHRSGSVVLAAADRLPRRRHGWWRAAAVLLVLSLAVLAVRSGLRHEHRFDAALDPSVVVVVS